MIKYLKEEKFEDEIKDGLVLVDFYADWCGPCQRMGRILEEMDDEKILKVNTDEHQDLAVSFGIMSIPTMILFKNGVEVSKKIGLMSKEELTEWIRSNK
mgnify:CR=1 FL=1